MFAVNINSEQDFSEKILFSDFVVQHLEISKLSLAPTTLKEYKRIIDKNLMPYFGNMVLSSIRPMYVQAFVNSLSGGYLWQDGKEGTLKPASVKRYYAVLASALSCAYCLELIASNPR